MVDAVERPRDQTTGMAKGFAFITFKDPAVVETIVGQRWLTLPNGARIECKDWLFIILGFYRYLGGGSNFGNRRIRHRTPPNS